MLNDGYLIPANTKRGTLIFSVFTGMDLIIFSIGVGTSLLLLLVLGAAETLNAIISLIPGLLSAFLVAIPILNYRNVLTFIKCMINFKFVEQQEFKWKGWCMYEQGQKQVRRRMDTSKKHR